MRATRLRLLWLVLVLLWAAPVWADGTQFNGNCTEVRWNANQESDLAGYYLYDRISLTATPSRIKTYGNQITSVTCASLGFNDGQHYLSISPFDLTGNEGARTGEVPFTIVRNNVIPDLRVTIVNATDMTLALTEVDDGTGQPAKYEVRYATPTINWPTSLAVPSGTCGPAVAGTTIGATLTCTITGLSPTTPYQFQVTPYRGILGSTAVAGPLSNITGATTGGAPPTPSDLVVLASDDYTRANNIDLGPDWTTIISSPWSIVANNARTPGAGAGFGVEVNTTVLPDNQWAEAIIQTITGSANLWVGVTVRASLTGHTSYQCLAARGTGLGSDVSKRVNGTATTLITEALTAWVSTDTIRCDAIGSTITLYRNSVAVLSVVDTEIPSGYAGIWGYIDATPANMELASFRAGGYAAAAADPCGCDQH